MKRRDATCCTVRVPGRAGDAFVSVQASRRLNVESCLDAQFLVCAHTLDANAANPRVPMIGKAGS